MPLPFEQPMFTGSTATQEALLGLPNLDPTAVLGPPQTPEAPGMPQLPPMAGAPALPAGAPIGAPVGVPAGGGGLGGGGGDTTDKIIQLLLRIAPGLAMGMAGGRGGIAGAGAVASGVSTALEQRQEQLNRDRALGQHDRQIGQQERQLQAAEQQRLAATQQHTRTAVQGILDHARAELSGIFSPEEFAARKAEVRQQLDQYGAGDLADTIRFPNSKLLAATAKEDGDHYDAFVKNHFGGDHLTAAAALADPVKSEYYLGMMFPSPIRGGQSVSLHAIIDAQGLHDDEHRFRPVERKQSNDIRTVPTQDSSGAWGTTGVRAEDTLGKFFAGKSDKPDKPERPREGPNVRTVNAAGDTEIVQLDERGKETRTRIAASPGFKAPGGGGDADFKAMLDTLNAGGGGAAPSTAPSTRTPAAKGERRRFPDGIRVWDGATWKRE